MEKRLFTVGEANDLLPYLTERMQHLKSLRRSLTRRAKKTAPSRDEITMRGGVPVGLAYFSQIRRLEKLVREIGSHGCQMKDLDSGLVDFPTLWEGREVYLCWKLGEPEVAFWHELHTGFAGRQPLGEAPR